MAHAGCCRAATDNAGFNDCQAHSLTGTLSRTRSPDDTGADDDHVVSFGAHLPMPMAKGSRASRIRSASAVIKAEPLIRGCTRLSTTLIVPSKILPTMLSCFQTCPYSSSPSANKHASLALVPVPHGERS